MTIRTQLRWGGAALALAACLTSLTGCGGSSSSNTAHIRSVDAATNAGTANIVINGGSSTADQTYFSVGGYEYIQGGKSSSFTFTTSVSLINNAILPSNSYNLSDGTYYSAYLIGRSDVPVASTSDTTIVTDPRFLQVIVASDSHDTPSGQVSVRVVHAAPDAGNVDVYINGIKTLTSVPYATISSFSNVASGTVTVQVNKTGTSTALIGPKTFSSVPSGHALTLLATEPSTTPTYDIQSILD